VGGGLIKNVALSCVAARRVAGRSAAGRCGLTLNPVECLIAGRAEPAIQSAVLWAEPADAYEQAGLRQMALENLSGDRIVKNHESGRAAPARNNRERPVHSLAGTSHAIRIGADRDGLHFVFVYAKRHIAFADTPGLEMLRKRRLPSPWNLLAKNSRNAVERLFERHGRDANLPCFVDRALLPPGAQFIGVRRFFFELRRIVLAALTVRADRFKVYFYDSHFRFSIKTLR